MFNTLNSDYIITAMFAISMGVTIGWVDRSDSRNRPISLALISLGCAMLSGIHARHEWGVTSYILSELFTTTAIISFFEWGHRIGRSVKGARRKIAEVFVRIGQVIALVYGIGQLIYVLVAPDFAVGSNDGLFRVYAHEVAIFVPLLGSAILCGLIAFAIMLTIKMDRAEKLRLRILQAASPFMLAGMVLNERWTPYAIAIGLMVLIAGSVRYLTIQGKRGQFMSQFMSDKVSDMVKHEGMDYVTRRHRLVLSVVMCDLRGFTQFARNNESEAVFGLLEKFYAAVGAAAAEHDGTVKDHAGDGVMLLVGAPVPVENHASKAIELADSLMHKGLKVLDDMQVSDQVGLGVGVATGVVTVGAIKGAGHLEYVAVGNAVNLASRLCDRAASGEILTDQRSADEAQPVLYSLASEARKPEKLKGYADPIEVCAVTIDSSLPLPKGKRRKKKKPKESTS